VSLVAYYLVGVVLGAGSSVIPGPCGLAVIDAGVRHGRRRAVATAAGAGLGDLSYAALGVFGIGRLLAHDRGLVVATLAVSGAVLIVYGLRCLRWRPVACTRPRHPLGGLLVGFATLVCNPGALVTWSAIVGTQLAGATPAAQLCAVIGIASGSLGWFTAMAYVSTRGKHVLVGRLQPFVQLVGGMLLIYGTVSIARAVL
jgi:threonine/homoserine/homoserine lactone efflux protein